MVDPERVSLIQGDFALVDDKKIDYAKVGPIYYLGSLPTMSKIRWFFSDNPLLLGFLGILICIVLAAIMYRTLRRIRAARVKKPS